MNFKIKKILSFGIISFLMVLAVANRTTAVGDLIGARDFISTYSLGTLADHSIRFGLPTTAQPIQTTDYIIVDFGAFEGPSEPSFIGGSYLGSPTYDVFDSKVRISGIYVSPGAYLAINGISAYNPQAASDFDIYVRVSSDIDGENVRNEAHILPLTSNNSAVIQANVESIAGTLIINGKTSPNVQVSFVEGGVAIGATSSSSDGTFSQQFPGISPGLHNIKISSVDSSNRLTTEMVVEIYTRSFEIITVNDVILSPTLSLDKTEIYRGETITVEGLGVPGYTAKIFTESPLESFEVVIGADGQFSYEITSTQTLDYGDHKVYAIVQDGFGLQSLMSYSSIFKVLSDDDTGPGPACNISTGDLTCDGSVDLLDFSVLMYNWTTNAAIADINNDKVVDLIDFSVMMFYWQGA